MDTISRAFKMMSRENFVPSNLKDSAWVDAPLPIGFNQTISQPSTVRNMLTWLHAQEGDYVLDIGSGSGWTTALISSIVGPSGKVFAIERIPELLQFGQENCQRRGLRNISFFLATNKLGLPGHAPYNRILVSASASRLPKNILDQLNIGGKLVIPVKNDILEITKTAPHAHSTIVHSGYVFVPLINQ